MVIANFKWTFILLCFLILVAVPQAAASTDWKITWNDNNDLLETVVTTNDSTAINPEGWQYTKRTDGAAYQRNIKDWQAYSRLNDRLPINIKVKNYLVFKSITFTALKSDAPVNTLAGQVGNKALNLSISVPGLIRAGSADETEEMTAVWHLKNLSELNSRGKMLVVDTIDGFILGLLIIVLGVLIIGLVFVGQIRKTHRTIESEYSLENLTLPEEQSEEIK